MSYQATGIIGGTMTEAIIARGQAAAIKKAAEEEAKKAAAAAAAAMPTPTPQIIPAATGPNYLLYGAIAAGALGLVFFLKRRKTRRAK